MRTLYIFLSLILVLASCSTHTSHHLPSQFNEISGIDNLGEGLLLSINDSGNGPFLYIMGEDNGSVLHKMFVSGARNIDWEDISVEGQDLYIGDIGNNLNDRKDLCIYKVRIEFNWSYTIQGVDTTHNFPDTLIAEPLSFYYPDQITFPPEDSQMNFDSEALTYADGKLLILSKDRSKPYKGICKIYETDLSNNLLEVKLLQEIQLKGASWLTGSVTGCDYLNNKLYVLTYKRLYIFERRKGQFELLRQKKLGLLQQWEGICVDSEEQIRIVAEKSRLGKQKMKIIKL